MKVCPQCHTPLIQRPDEKPWKFAKRVFCSEKCRAADVREKFWLGPRKPPPPKRSKGPKTDDPNVWLQHNKPTQLPPGYAMGAVTFDQIVRPTFSLQRRGR